VRWVMPSRLDSVDTVFAMTVHKSQGSEFAHVLLVLPAPRVTRTHPRAGVHRPHPSQTTFDDLGTAAGCALQRLCETGFEEWGAG